MGEANRTVPSRLKRLNLSALAEPLMGLGQARCEDKLSHAIASQLCRVLMQSQAADQPITRTIGRQVEHCSPQAGQANHAKTHRLV